MRGELREHFDDGSPLRPKGLRHARADAVSDALCTRGVFDEDRELIASHPSNPSAFCLRGDETSHCQETGVCGFNASGMVHVSEVVGIEQEHGSAGRFIPSRLDAAAELLSSEHAGHAVMRADGPAQPVKAAPKALRAEPLGTSSKSGKTNPGDIA